MKKLVAIAVILLAFGNDYDYLRALRWNSTGDFKRWWNYRCERVIQQGEVASSGKDTASAAVVGHVDAHWAALRATLNHCLVTYFSSDCSRVAVHDDHTRSRGNP